MITFKLEIFFIYQLFCLLREAEILYQLRVQALLLDFGFEFSYHQLLVMWLWSR